MSTLSRMVRINDGGVGARFDPNAPTAKESGKAAQAPLVGSQIQQILFGAPKPVVLNPANFPHIAEQMLILDKFRRKLAFMADEDEEDFSIELADSGIAMIDEDGVVDVGVRFLEAAQGNVNLLVGVLAHEIGHRPKRWKKYRTRRRLSQKEIDAICRHEETLADLFSGRALAELGLDCESMIAFLLAIDAGEKPHPRYFSPETRGEVIRDAHAAQHGRRNARKKIFPELDRMTSPHGHIGEA